MDRFRRILRTPLPVFAASADGRFTAIRSISGVSWWSRADVQAASTETKIESS